MPHRLAWPQLDRLFRHGSPVGLSDRSLLDRFLHHHDEAAFEALLARHGPMVLGVCRRMLANPADVEDAFQATFLVLVRKARQIRDADRLGPWLHGVATHIARKAHARAVIHSARQASLPAVSPQETLTPVPHHERQAELREVLDHEIARLAPRHREILILCLLQGVESATAAQILRCPPGTIKSRLSRARDALRRRLERRGFSTAGLFITQIPQFNHGSLAPAVPDALAQATHRVALEALLQPAAGSLAAHVIPATVSELTQGGLLTMLTLKSRIVTLALSGTLLLGAGVGAKWLADASAQQAPDASPPPADAAGAAGSLPAPAPWMDREAVETSNKLKQILLAFHNYAHARNLDTSKSTLPRFAMFNELDIPSFSWRVAILPFLGDEATNLYRQFKFDEPWDSPTNRKLVALMPAVFQVGPPTPVGHTRVRGFLGKNQAGNTPLFRGYESTTFADVTDGASRTIAVVVSSEPVPWTKPEGIPFGKTPSPLDMIAFSPDERGLERTLIGFADGSVRTVDRTTLQRDAILNALITMNGGEVIEHIGLSTDQQPTTPAQPDAAPTAAAGLPPSGGTAIPGQPAAGRPGRGTAADTHPPAGIGGMMKASRGGMSGAPSMGMMPGMMGGGLAVGGEAGAALPPPLEARLQALEAKLDRILQLLEGVPPGARAAQPPAAETGRR